MKKYLCVFTGAPFGMEAWLKLPEDERMRKQTEGIAAWKQWGVDNAASIVEMGGPLSKTKLTSKAGITDIRNNMSGFSIVQAESQEAAAKLFIGHPHFTIFPGVGVEVMEILPIPAG